MHSVKESSGNLLNRHRRVQSIEWIAPCILFHSSTFTTVTRLQQTESMLPVVQLLVEKGGGRGETRSGYAMNWRGMVSRSWCPTAIDQKIPPRGAARCSSACAGRLRGLPVNWRSTV